MMKKQIEGLLWKFKRSGVKIKNKREKKVEKGHSRQTGGQLATRVA